MPFAPLLPVRYYSSMTLITLYALASVFIVSFISLVGVLALAFNIERLKKIVFVLVSLATGALLGGAFLHLVPEIYEGSANAAFSSILIIAGILVFFVLEKFFHWHHLHGSEEEECHEGVHWTRDFCEPNPIKPVGHMILISDGLHNFVDGIIIGASYLISVEIGIATTIAIILHEIPQEIGDFGVLLHAGYTKGKALFYNFLSALLAVIGTIVALGIQETAEEFTAWIIPLAAGGFIYIACSDLIPELHKTPEVKKSIFQFLAIVIGIGAMYALLSLEV